jgi:hypothetical protein
MSGSFPPESEARAYRGAAAPESPQDGHTSPRKSCVSHRWPIAESTSHPIRPLQLGHRMPSATQRCAPTAQAIIATPNTTGRVPFPVPNET